MDKITLLAISGSLRSGSYNTAVLEAMCELAPDLFEIKLAAISVPLLGRELDSEGILADDELTQVITCQLGIFCNQINNMHL